MTVKFCPSAARFSAKIALVATVAATVASIGSTAHSLTPGLHAHAAASVTAASTQPGSTAPAAPPAPNGVHGWD